MVENYKLHANNKQRQIDHLIERAEIVLCSFQEQQKMNGGHKFCQKQNVFFCIYALKQMCAANCCCEWKVVKKGRISVHNYVQQIIQVGPENSCKHHHKCCWNVWKKDWRHKSCTNYKLLYNVTQTLRALLLLFSFKYLYICYDEKWAVKWRQLTGKSVSHHELKIEGISKLLLNGLLPPAAKCPFNMHSIQYFSNIYVQRRRKVWLLIRCPSPADQTDQSNPMRNSLSLNKRGKENI